MGAASVIILVCKADKCIDAAIKSALYQTRPAKGIIVGDCANMDRTVEMLREVSSLSPTALLNLHLGNLCFGCLETCRRTTHGVKCKKHRIVDWWSCRHWQRGWTT